MTEGKDVKWVWRVKKETIQNSVPWRFDYAIGKRSSNMIANWLLTACHSRTERFHS